MSDHEQVTPDGADAAAAEGATLLLPALGLAVADDTPGRRLPRTLPRQRWLMSGAAALVALALLGGGAAVGTHAGVWPGSPLGLAWFAGATATSRPTATPTLMPTPTATATPTPTITPTPTVVAHPGGPVPTWTGPIDLGCGAASLNPPPWVIRSGPATAPLVALTFDDGPSPDQTANILTTLEQYHAPATFFVVGASARDRPWLIQREAADGFTIAMHTWDHPYMTGLAPASRAWELAATAQAIHNAVGANYCLPFWRPPFGDYNSDVLAQTQSLGLATVTWSVDPADYNAPGVQTIVDRVLSNARPGSIVLLHDGYFFRWQTAQALPAIIDGLRARGFTLATLPQVLAGQMPATPTPQPTATPTNPPATPTATATATATAAPSPTATP